MLRLRINWDSVEAIFGNTELTRLITVDKMKPLVATKVDTTMKKRTKVIADPNGNELICHYDPESLLKRESGKCDVCESECLIVGMPIDIEISDNVYFIYDTVKYGSFCSTKCARSSLSKIELTESVRLDILGVIATLTLAEQSMKPLDPIDEILAGNNLFFMSDDKIIVRLPCIMPIMKSAYASHSLGIHIKSPKAYDILEKLKCNWQ